MTEFRVVLPLPPPELNPNSRAHFFAKRKSAAAYAEQVAVLISNAYPGQTWPRFIRAALAVEFIYRDERRRDIDNALASLKPAIDVFVRIGVLPDDSWRYLHGITVTARADRKQRTAQMAICIQGEEGQ